MLCMQQDGVASNDWTERKCLKEIRMQFINYYSKKTAIFVKFAVLRKKYSAGFQNEPK